MLRSVKALFERDLAITESLDRGYARRLREAVTTCFLDTNEFSLSDVPPEERLLIGPRTTGRLGARHNPDVARQALEESRGEVEAVLKEHAIVILIGTGGKGTGAGTMFPLAQLARQHHKLVLPIFVRPSFERHEVDKRRYDHALNVIDQFDAAGIRLIEILNDRGYTESSPQPQAVVWEQMNLPIARGLRGLIYVLWELSQVDPSDLSTLFAGNGRLRIGFADIEAAAGEEPGEAEIEQAARRCWDNPYYAFGKPPGTSLICIQGDWSNVVDARIKGHLATLAMGGRGDAPYTPLYARAAYSPRPWGVTMLLAEHTGTHQPLAIDWSFARAAVPPAPNVPVSMPSPASAPTPARAASTRHAGPSTGASTGDTFSNLWEFAVAVNRSNPAALALAHGSPGAMTLDGAEVRKLLGTLWFRGVVARLSAPWRAGLFDALRASVEVPDHLVKAGRQYVGLSQLAPGQLRDLLTAPSLPEAIRPDVELLVTIGNVWGEEALRQLRFQETAPRPAPSGFASLLQGIRPKISRWG